MDTLPPAPDSVSTPSCTVACSAMLRSASCAKACSKADAVIVYAFGPAAEVWWRGIENKLTRLDKLQVWRIPAADAQALAGLAERSIALQATLQEGVLTLSSARGSVALEPLRWK